MSPSYVRAEGRAETIIEVLSARSIVFSDEQRDRILAERALSRLAEWVRRVATCANIDDLFGAD